MNGDLLTRCDYCTTASMKGRDSGLDSVTGASPISSTAHSDLSLVCVVYTLMDQKQLV